MCVFTWDIYLFILDFTYLFLSKVFFLLIYF